MDQKEHEVDQKIGDLTRVEQVPIFWDVTFVNLVVDYSLTVDDVDDNHDDATNQTSVKKQVLILVVWVILCRVVLRG